MNKIKREFSIRDLENLSGIKAHTIRIWEKRYQLLNPERTTTNIRTYSLESLQKLLNISLLYQAGHKISKIAKLTHEELLQLVGELAQNNNNNTHAIVGLKQAMINFDQEAFYEIYHQLSTQMGFREIWQQVLVPFLHEIGLLWQTDVICPSQEHFISHLIKQLIFTNTAQLKPQVQQNNEATYVLFLPENEIHELGLLYLNYEIRLMGHNTIYLGQATPLESMEDLKQHFHKIIFISYFTVAPAPDKIEKYMADFHRLINNKNLHQLWILGHQANQLEASQIPEGISTFNNLESVLRALPKNTPFQKEPII
ncbi:MerR family transcriptional regulator [Arenibacter amylolyticus]|uniref:MerR family transcriptional regulator n=1 Tax=Arenibacter amylolyticus TaxID=1406873 RepID=UPI000A3ABE41|nr:MerR family transcriptional regulator [Arenibacter amylolyticus]